MSYYGLLVHGGYPLRRWARLEVRGRELLPATGPVLVVANHDSMIDPLALVAACYPVRQVRFLAMAELWRHRPVGFILDRIGQIPLERGGGGEHALRHALAGLDRGEAIGIFPEGRLSRGQALRAHRGIAQLMAARPGVPVLLAAVTGTDDVVRFPKRPRARVEFLGLADPPEHSDATEIAAALLDHIRTVAPPVAAGRQGRVAVWWRARRRAVNPASGQHEAK